MELTPQFAVIVPVILGVVQVAKIAGLPSKWAPLLSVLCGVSVALLVDGVTVESGFLGVLAGLSASGLWSGTKATMR